MAVVKEPVMERNMSQLREGSLSLNLGSPSNHDEMIVSSCSRWTYVPIIRKAGFSTVLGPEEGKAFFAASASPDFGFSAMFLKLSTSMVRMILITIIPLGLSSITYKGPYCPYIINLSYCGQLRFILPLAAVS